MKKVFIMGGGGTIGSATASRLAYGGMVDEIVLFNRNRNTAESHVIDIAQSVFDRSNTKITLGEWRDLSGCAVVIVAAGLPAAAATHDTKKDIGAMMPMIRNLAENLKTYAPDAVVLSLTNPLDAFNYVLYSVSGLPARQFVALSQNDSLRFRWALGEVLGVAPARCGGYVFGEHGPKKLPMFSTVTLDGRPLSLSEEEKALVLERMDGLWKRFLEVSGNRTAGWTTGAAAAQVVEAVFSGGELPVTCSYIAREGQGYSLGGPVLLDTTGVLAPVELDLWPEEAAALRTACENARSDIGALLAYLSENFDLGA